MSTRPVDFLSISGEIISLGMRLGNVEGQARARGYLIQSARVFVLDNLGLSILKKHGETIAQLQTELDKIYSNLSSISSDLEGISVPELKDIFNNQIKPIHQARGVLADSLKVCDSLVNAHILIEEVNQSAVLVQDQVSLFIAGKIGSEKWESINDSIKSLLHRLRIVSPDSDQGMSGLCPGYVELKQQILKSLTRCQSDLESKKVELIEKSHLNCVATLGVLLPALEKKITDQVIEDIQCLFGSLPLDFRTLVFEERGIFPDEKQKEKEVVFQTPSNRGASSDIWAEVRGLSYRERDLNQYESSVNAILGRGGEERRTETSLRETARESLNKFVAKLPEDEIRNPKLLLEAFDRIFSKHPTYKPLILEASRADLPKEKVEVIPVVDPTPVLNIAIEPAKANPLLLPPTSVAQQRRNSSPTPGWTGNRGALRPSEVAAKNKISKAPSPAPILTEIKVKCKVPEGHFLAIRGKGGDLDWSQGKKLTKLDGDTYVYRMEGVTGKVEYKIVLDDIHFEGGKDHVIEAQKSEEIVPTLEMPRVAVVVNFTPKDGKLFICGTGPGMCWDQNKKIEVKCINGRFVLESTSGMGTFEFKILLSNNQWSQGGNFKAEKGKTLEITPKF